MARIYKTTDRIAIRIDDITVKISPLSLIQKNQIQQIMLEGQKTSDLAKLSEGLILALKFCLKAMDGVTDSDGNPYPLKFDGDMLSDECVNDLMNMNQSAKLVQVCSAMASGVPTSFKLEGVSFAEPDTKKKNKK